MSKSNTSKLNGSLKQLRIVLKELNQQKIFKGTFLVKQDETLIPIKTRDFAYFYTKTGVVVGTTFNKEFFTIDSKLERLELELNPRQFYRLNRQFIVQRNAVNRIKYASNGKLRVIVSPESNNPLIVSKSKSKSFKKWMAE